MGQLGRVRRADDPDAYVYRILVNTLSTSHRRRWWGERPTDRAPDRAVADATADVELRDTVVRATAEALGIPVGTIKSRVSRALAASTSPSSPRRSCDRPPRRPRPGRPAGRAAAPRR